MTVEAHTLIQGNHNSFHAEAAVKMGIARAACLPMTTHKELYEALRAGDAQDAVVAVANSGIGRIVGSYDELLAGDLTVTDRVDLPIAFGLYGIPGATKEDIRVFHTQSHAYKQCTRTLAQELPQAHWQEEEDTAGSALIVQELGDKSHAAICPKRAGEAALLKCLYYPFQDDKNSRTTFYRIGRRGVAKSPADADTAVAILDTENYGQAKKHLRYANIRMKPLSAAEKGNSPLIIEIETTNPAETLQEASLALAGIGSIRYLGGYTRGRHNGQHPKKQR